MVLLKTRLYRLLYFSLASSALSCSRDGSSRGEFTFCFICLSLSILPEHFPRGFPACGPAFVDLFIEALADGGVACGLPRASALEFAAQMVAGSARLVLESGKHPGVLKDAVCSPGGTTIQGVRALEEGGFRGTVMNAVIKAYEKNFDLK